MAYDLKLTHSSLYLTRPIAAGNTISQEGKILCSVLEDGVEKALVKAVVAGTEKVIGFAKEVADAQPDRTSAVEVVTVPSAPAALELDLRNQNLVTGSVRAVVVSSGLVLTVDYVYAGATANNAVKVDAATGRMKFHADEAGEDVTVTYLYDLTVVQSIQKFGERFFNNRNLHAVHGVTEVGTGIGELHTDQFDASQDYSVSPVLTLGDGGIITVGGPGPVLPATVISVPSADGSPFLGVRFNFVV
jgi:hypothetical protein